MWAHDCSFRDSKWNNHDSPRTVRSQISPELLCVTFTSDRERRNRKSTTLLRIGLGIALCRNPPSFRVYCEHDRVRTGTLVTNHQSHGRGRQVTDVGSATVTFAGQTVGTTSSTQVITVKNNRTNTLTGISIASSDLYLGITAFIPSVAGIRTWRLRSRAVDQVYRQPKAKVTSPSGSLLRVLSRNSAHPD